MRRKPKNEKEEERSERNCYFFTISMEDLRVVPAPQTRVPFLNVAPKIRVCAVNRAQASFTSPPDPNQY